MERKPKPGEFYRHFKNKLYQVLAVASHSETGEQMVVYQALYGDYGVYVRPLDMFVSEVDREKYPQAEQKYRFEQVWPGDLSCGRGNEETPETDSQERDDSRAEMTGQAERPADPNPWLLRFLEAESLEEKMACVRLMEGKVGREEVDSICLSLDLPFGDGDTTVRLRRIYGHLETQNKYDGNRLRER